MARPTKLTPKRHKEIVAQVKLGVTPSVAASMCGVGDRTYYEWMARGRQQEEPFAQFARDIVEAESVIRAEAEKVLRLAFTGIKKKELARNTNATP